jgi:4-amino-4-deoxy-L-arabinose transferase-like glycosyltransferase
MDAAIYGNSARWGKSEASTLALLVLLVAATAFVGLGALPLLGKDEPRYAEVAREMLTSGDWITPRLAGQPWLEKPALPYWLMALGFWLFGVSEFSARLGSALCAVLGIAVVCALGREFRSGRLAAAVLATSPFWIGFGRGASFDMPLAASMAVAVASLFRWDTAESRCARMLWALALGAATGLAMLAKGLAGPLLIGLIASAYLLLQWRRPPAGVSSAVLAVGAFLAVAATWYVPVWQANGWAFIDEFFIQHHFQRYVSDKYRHPQPFYFYIPVVLAGLLPWTPLLFTRWRDAWGLLRRPVTAEGRLLLLAVLWAATPVAFFSASGSKLPGYVLPSFPGLALLVAWFVSLQTVWPLRASAVCLAGLGIGLGWYSWTELGDAGAAVGVGVPVIAAAVTAWRLLGERAVASLAGGVAIAVVLTTGLLAEAIGQRESLALLASAADGHLAANERVLLYGVIEYAPAFYTKGRVVLNADGEIEIAETADRVEELASHSGSVLVVTDMNRADELATRPALRVYTLGRQRNRTLLRCVAGSGATEKRSD